MRNVQNRGRERERARWCQRLAGAALAFSAVMLWKIGSVEQALPRTLYLAEAQPCGEQAMVARAEPETGFGDDQSLPVQTESDEQKTAAQQAAVMEMPRLCNGEVTLTRSGSDEAAEARLWGFISVGEVRVCQVERPYLLPCGQPFGVKLLTEGVVVVTPTDTASGYSPAGEAGVCGGDVLLSVDGAGVSSAQDITRILHGNHGRAVQLKLERDGSPLELTVTPDTDGQGCGSLGLLVRDSSAGIGTLTWYDPVTGGFGGLGHGVCDTDTGQVLPLGKGEAVAVSVTGVERARSGDPGALVGLFDAHAVIGELSANTDHGVFGRLYAPPGEGKVLPIAYAHEVHTGKAQILSTLSGRDPQLYDIEIKRLDTSSPDNHRDMVLRITDDRLLRETGGIVQGMSGSPILQDGRLIGAVTHVFVNSPETGYGILIENMLPQTP